MKQFDVYATGLENTPFAVCIQSDFLENLNTRTLVPLRPAASALGKNPISRLTPAIDVLGQPYVLDTPRLAAVNAKHYKGPIASLVGQRQTILDAVDFLIHGY